MAGLIQFLRHHPEVTADYDRSADVLYVSRGLPTSGEGETHSRGVVLRFAFDSNRPIGVTVIGFHRNRWDQQITELATLISGHIGVRGRTIEMTIREALNETKGP